MIVLCAKAGEKIVGYLWGLGAIVIELIFSSMTFIYVFIILSECAMYMKGGAIIVNGGVGIDKKEKETLKNTDWFFNK